MVPLKFLIMLPEFEDLLPSKYFVTMTMIVFASVPLLAVSSPQDIHSNFLLGSQTIEFCCRMTFFGKRKKSLVLF
jgi:hypothetical protein